MAGVEPVHFRVGQNQRFAVHLPAAPPLPNTAYRESPAARRAAGDHSLIPRLVEFHLAIPE